MGWMAGRRARPSPSTTGRPTSSSCAVCMRHPPPRGSPFWSAGRIPRPCPRPASVAGRSVSPPGAARSARPPRSTACPSTWPPSPGTVRVSSYCIPPAAAPPPPPSAGSRSRPTASSKGRGIWKAFRPDRSSVPRRWAKRSRDSCCGPSRARAVRSSTSSASGLTASGSADRLSCSMPEPWATSESRPIRKAATRCSSPRFRRMPAATESSSCA